jgi:superfamily II DNA or RNA helicase
MITGSESDKQKVEAKRRFTEGDSQVLLISLRAGQGIDGLQHVCSIVVFAELDWAPAVHEQAAGRVFRDGQKNPVTAFFLLSDEGSDPTIAEALGLKYEQSEGIRDPEAELVEKLQIDEERIRKLAKQYLEKEAEKAAAPIDPETETDSEPEPEPDLELKMEPELDQNLAEQ